MYSTSNLQSSHSIRNIFILHLIRISPRVPAVFYFTVWSAVVPKVSLEWIFFCFLDFPSSLLKYKKSFFFRKNLGLESCISQNIRNFFRVLFFFRVRKVPSWNFITLGLFLLIISSFPVIFMNKRHDICSSYRMFSCFFMIRCDYQAVLKAFIIFYIDRIYCCFFVFYLIRTIYIWSATFKIYFMAFLIE